MSTMVLTDIDYQSQHKTTNSGTELDGYCCPKTQPKPISLKMPQKLSIKDWVRVTQNLRTILMDG